MTSGRFRNANGKHQGVHRHRWIPNNFGGFAASDDSSEVNCL
jgi:hypothetical protein